MCCVSDLHSVTAITTSQSLLEHKGPSKQEMYIHTHTHTHTGTAHTHLRTLMSVTTAPAADLRATTLSSRLSLAARSVSANVLPASNTCRTEREREVARLLRWDYDMKNEN